MAKDGHKIIGPYKDDGSLWNCIQLDVCNGIRDLSSNTYTYVASTIFPYMVGCFGPGAYITYNSDCSTNQCSAGYLNLHSFTLQKALLIILGAYSLFGI